jgi:ketosteroid isomerase-like protein
MSAGNVEVVRRWIEAYNRRDIEGLLELSDPEIEFRSIFAGIESGGAFRGRSGVYEYFTAIEDAYQSFQVPPDDFLDAGAAVFLLAHAVWTGRGSGASDRTPIFVAVWLRAAKVMRVETFTDRQQGLAAVGLDDESIRSARPAG